MITAIEAQHRKEGHEVKAYARAFVISVVGPATNCGGTRWEQCSCGVRFNERSFSFTRWK